MSGDEKAKATPRSRSTASRAKARPEGAATAAPKAAAKADAPAATNGKGRGQGFQPPVYSGLRLRYHEEAVPALQRDFSYANPMQIPRLDKVVVNIGLGEAIQTPRRWTPRSAT